MQNYKQLLKKIDTLTHEIRARHPGSFKCRPGCTDCCVAGITVCRVEFDHISQHSLRMSHDAGRMTQVACRITPHTTDKCLLLDKKGTCRIYERRPIVCRLWGAPLLFASDEANILRAKSRSNACSRPCSNSKVGQGTLSVCKKNFIKSPAIEELGSKDIIFMDRVLETLAAINHVYCKKTGFDPVERFKIST